MNKTNRYNRDRLVVQEKLPIQLNIRKEKILHLIKVKKLRKRIHEIEEEIRAAGVQNWCNYIQQTEILNVTHHK